MIEGSGPEDEGRSPPRSSSSSLWWPWSTGWCAGVSAAGAGAGRAPFPERYAGASAAGLGWAGSSWLACCLTSVR